MGVNVVGMWQSGFDTTHSQTAQNTHTHTRTHTLIYCHHRPATASPASQPTSTIIFRSTVALKSVAHKYTQRYAHRLKRTRTPSYRVDPEKKIMQFETWYF